jgi:uncharacterized protein YvpB
MLAFLFLQIFKEKAGKGMCIRNINKQFMKLVLIMAVMMVIVESRQISGFTSISASASTVTYTAADNLNIRSGPSTAYSILGVVKKGIKLNVISKFSSSWYKVNYNGKTGYADAAYVKTSTSEPVTYQYMTTDDLNVRTGPSVSYKAIGLLKKGTVIKTNYKPSNGWCKIIYNGKTAYVSSAYLTTVSQASTVILNVPVVRQNPELPAGCEVTSLTMALQYKGIHVDKMTLARKMPYTKTLDPNKGYVGSPYNGTGYTINPVKLQVLAKSYRSKSADMTGSSIAAIEKEVRVGNPVLVWFTIGYVDVYNLHHYKYLNGHKYWWPQPLHCIVVTGASSSNFYINDPLNGKKNHAILKTRFNQIYIEMGKRALVVR